MEEKNKEKNKEEKVSWSFADFLSESQRDRLLDKFGKKSDK